MAESVLQQPPVLVPIVAVQGGGGMTDSVLTQPAAGGEVPIVPVQGGGGNEPSLQVFTFSPKKPPEPVDKKLRKANIISYISSREELWGKLYDSKQVKITREQTIKDANANPKTLTLGEDIIYIFFVQNPEQLEKIKAFILGTDAEKNYIYILINDTGNEQRNFSLVSKSIIEFIYTNKYDITKGDNQKDEKDQRDIYFLFDRPVIDISLNSKEKRFSFQDKKPVSLSILYLEPSHIIIPFKKDGVDMKFVITGMKGPPVELTTNYILLTSYREDIADRLPITKEKTLLKNITNKKFTFDKKYLESKYIKLEFNDLDDENDATPAAATPAAATPAAATPAAATPAAATPAAATPAATPAAAAVPPPVTPVKPAVKPYLIQLRPEVTIDIGGNIFTIRKALSSIMEEWKKGNFTYYNPEEATATPTSLARPHLAEKDLFTEIGINEAFLQDPHSETKQALLDRRAGFLQNLVLYQCFNSHNIRYECDMVREFLQDLLELKQIERLSKITRSFITTNVNVELRDSLNKDEPSALNTMKTVENLLATLFVEVPTVKLRKQGNRPDFSLSGFISPLSGLDSLLSGKKAPLVSTKLPVPTGALNFSSLFASSTPAVAFTPVVPHTRRRLALPSLPTFDFPGVFRRRTSGGAKNTTRRRRRSAKP